MKTLVLPCMIVAGFCVGKGLGASPVEAPLGVDDLTVVSGAVNGAFFHKDGKVLAVYGDPRPDPAPVDTVLFTHHRRDVAWAGRALVEKGAKSVVPAKENDLFASVDGYWANFQKARFHDYAQQSSKVLCAPMIVSQQVRGGETVTWQGEAIRVLDTPGYTRGAVTYFLSHAGKTVAFTGDLIYGDGKLTDLYSLQDAIPDTKADAYHAYAGRLGDLLESLRKVAAEKPDLLVPSRGPVITDPQASINKLVTRLQALYRNYLSVDALRWYFKDDHIRAKALRVLGSSDVLWMPMAEKFPNDTPPWLVVIENSRLLLSGDGSGFLLDCGMNKVLNELKQRRAAGSLKSIDGVFITHYHDDHTDLIPTLVKEFGSTVYAHRNLEDILVNPSAYRMPCLTTVPINLSCRLAEGATWRWKEFMMTVYDFPGQTLYHNALLVEKDKGEKILFVGDSFTPCGMDDYCLQNRNLMHEGMGYLKCLDLIEKMPPGTWLVNQHVEPAFRFSPEQLQTLRETLVKRWTLLQDLSPWDDPNYLVDEGWARCYPYFMQERACKTARCWVRIMNHSPETQTYVVNAHLPDGWKADAVTPAGLRVPPRQEGSAEVQFTIPKDCKPGRYILSADVQWPGGDLREWVEAIVNVEEPGRN